MKTEKLYDLDSHLYDFSATVLDCKHIDERYEIILDKTAFFPEGGGQSADTGKIADANITDVQIDDGVITHCSDSPVEIGSTVECHIDAPKRFRRMQNHSGEHIVSGIVHKLFGYDNVGFHLGDDVTVDFNGELSDEQLAHVERLANEAIYKNVRFICEYPDPETLNFGKINAKKPRDQKEKTTFEQVAGADEEKEELSEMVDFLKCPDKFSTLGARIPKGVLLVGPPGTGKTLLARAVAGEADVPFFSISGSDFVEMYVGVGASRVRDLFDQAKKEAPSVIFIDEIDAVGRHRGAGMGGGHDEREQTLNQLLVEMDGFEKNQGVIVIAATNRPDILDPALLRPGRFDRQVRVGYPDTKGREAILKVHSKNKPLAPDVDLGVIANSTVGFVGADLENLLNEAALLAARRNKKAITMAEIEEATVKVIVGTEKKSHKMSDKEKKLTAYHEAGHAISTYYLESQDPVRQVSIIPRGSAGGYTMSVPTEDKSYKTKNGMLDDIVVLLGGRVAEKLVLGDISTGASNDIERATKLAKSMVTEYGMSDRIGPVSYSSGSGEVFLGRDYGHAKDYSEAFAQEIDEEISSIIHNGYDRTEKILSDHMDKLHELAQYLIKYEKIDGDKFNKLMEGTLVEDVEEPQTMPVVDEVKEAEENGEE